MCTREIANDDRERERTGEREEDKGEGKREQGSVFAVENDEDEDGSFGM